MEHAMVIGKHIKRLRQEKGWSQAQLANKLNVHQKQISGYERNIHVPSTDVIIRTAKLFDVSLDYLVFEEREDALSVKIADRELLRRLEEVD
jgi:transcriptional regulator with XRE-family HTH domain